MNYSFTQTDYDDRVREVYLDRYVHFGDSKGPRLARFHVAVELALQTEDLTSDDIYEQVSDDSADEGIDFFYTSLEGGVPQVHVFQAKDSKSLPNAEQKAAVLKMVAEIRNLLGKKNSVGLGDRRRTRLQDLKQATKNPQAGFVYYLLLTGDQPSRLNFEEHFTPDDFNPNSELVILDKPALLKLMNQGVIPVEPEVKLNWRKEDHFLFEKSGIKVIQGYITAKEFVEQTKNWKDSIFKLNPRLFLANKRSGPNQQMLNTLHSDEAGYFHILNNGITAVCKDLRGEDTSSTAALTISDFQIVNGCQTTSTLWSWAKDFPNNLDSVYVNLKIIQAPSLAARISETTNSQNSINFVDLASNSETQIRIKTALEGISRMPYLYVNRRGTWENLKNRSRYEIKDWGKTRGTHYRRIDIRELSQAMIAIAGKPHRAKENLIDIFSSKETYATLFEKSWQSGEQLALISDLYLFSSNLDFWPRQPSSGAAELAAMARFYVCYLVYSSLKGDGNPQFIESSSEFSFDLIDERLSKEIRADFVNNVGQLAWAALEALDSVLQNEIHLGKQIEKRALTRKEDFKKAIENAYRNNLKFIN